MCINFFQTEITWHSPAVLEEMTFLMGSLPPSLHPAGCHTGHQFSKFGGKQRAFGC